jgi:hypothetical protein
MRAGLIQKCGHLRDKVLKHCDRLVKMLIAMQKRHCFKRVQGPRRPLIWSPILWRGDRRIACWGARSCEKIPVHGLQLLPQIASDVKRSLRKV